MSDAWISLTIAALGVFGSVGGTLAGVVITQRKADQREALQWRRSREVEREQWAREDALRTFDQRRTCYIEFEETLRTIALTVERAKTGMGVALEEDWQLPAFHGLLRLQVFATAEAVEAANAAYSALWRWGNSGNDGEIGGDEHDAEFVYDEAHDQFMATIRRDLGLGEQVAPVVDEEGQSVSIHGVPGLGVN